MTPKTTYRHFIAILLLAVYAFIAAPVQLWHNHGGGQGKEVTASVSSAEDCVIAADTEASSDADCPVCQHQYASYYADASVAQEMIITTPATLNGWYAQHALSLFALTASNKGPPALS